MKSLALKTLAVAAILWGMLALNACHTTLAPGGVYDGDKIAYTIDKTAVDSYDALNGFVTWEFQQHDVIVKTWPQVTQAAEYVRDHAPDWYLAVGIAKGSYLQAAAKFRAASTNSNPVDPNLTASLQSARQNLLDKVAEIGQQRTNYATLLREANVPGAPNLLKAGPSKALK